MAINIGEIQADLTARSDQFRREMRRAERAVDRVGDESVRAERQVSRSMQGMARSAAIAQAALLGVATAGLATVGIALTSFVRSSVNAALRTEALEQSFTTFLGSAEAMRETLQFIRDEADRLGLPFIDLAESFRGLAAASRGTALEGAATREIFIAIAEASRVMGLTADQTRGALNAIQQIMSKGSVQAEELRGQLGERLFGAFQRAAEAIGVTTQELNKLLEQGLVPADKFIPAFAVRIRQFVAEGVERASESAAAGFARLQNSLFQLRNAFGRSGLLDLLNTLVNAATAVLNLLPGAEPTSIQKVARLIQEQERLNKIIQVITQSLKDMRQANEEFATPGLTEQIAFQEQQLKRLQERYQEIGEELVSLRKLAEAVKKPLQLEPFVVPSTAIDVATEAEARAAVNAIRERLEREAINAELDRQAQIMERVRQIGADIFRGLQLQADTLQQTFRTPMEVLRDTQETLATLSNEFGERFEPTARRALRAAQIEFARTTLAGQALEVVAQGINDAFTSSFEGVIRGTQSVSEAFRNMVQSILLSIGRLLAQRAILALLDLALGAIGRVLSPTSTATSLGASGAINAGGGAPSAGGLFGAFEMQRGGIVRRPTFALVGERGPEAVVPLEALNNLGGDITIINVVDRQQAQERAQLEREAGRRVTINDMTEAVLMGEGNSFVQALRMIMR